MDKDGPVNGKGRTPTERLTLVEARLDVVVMVLKWLVGGLIAALAKILWDTLKP